jgi:hypothetical protein
MPHLDITEVRRLFERSEKESDPSRKFSTLEEALELIDLVRDDSTVSQSDKDIALNLCRSHIRRLLTQLVNIRNIEFGDWWDYVHLLLFERKDEVATILAENTTLNESYQAFVGIWKDELIEALERAQSGL